MIHFVTPFSLSKDLGAEYNRSCSLIPDGDHICIMDYDVCFLSPNSIPIIYEYVKQYPNDVLTCWQSRGHDLAAQTIKGCVDDDLLLIKETVLMCEQLRDFGSLPVHEITKHLSGFCLVFPKSLWKEVPFKEGIGCLSVDTNWMKDLQAKGKKVYLMERVLALHAYRLHDKQDKSHLA